MISQYGTSILPIVARAVEQKRCDDQCLREFLTYAWAEYALDVEKTQHLRREATSRTRGRRERLSLARYFDLAQRVNKAVHAALKSLERYLTSGNKRWLEVSMRRYEAGQRHLEAKVKLRMKLAPTLCERLSRVSLPKAS